MSLFHLTPISFIIIIYISFIIIYISFLYASFPLGQNSCTTVLNNTLRLNLKDPSLSSYNSETGRLELCSCTDSSSCSWNTLIASVTNGWSWKNVQVACRQLARDTGSSYVGLGNPVFQTA